MASWDTIAIKACQDGDVAALRAALTGGANLEALLSLDEQPATDPTETMPGSMAQAATAHTLLMVAAGLGHAPCCRELLEAGARVNALTPQNANAAILAARGGHAACLEILIEAGIDIHQRKDMGWSALAFAAQNGSQACVDMLLAHGAGEDTEFVDTSDGMRALAAAAGWGHLGCVASLIKAGANAHDAGEPGDTTVLMFAAQGGSVDCVKALLALNVDIHATTSNGFTALMIAARDGREEVLTALLQAGAKVECETNHGWTALTLAAHNGLAGCVRLLSEAGAKLDQATHGGDSDDEAKATPAGLSARGGFIDSLAMLGDLGVDLLAPDPAGRTPAVQAARHDQTKTLRLLLNMGADPFQLDPEHGSLARACCARGSHACLTMLIQAGASVGPRELTLAASLGHAACAQAIIDAGVHPDARGNRGWTGLMWAAHAGHRETLAMLIKAGANIHAREEGPDSMGRGAAALALARNESGCLAILAKAGAALTDKDSQGRSLAALATQMGHGESLDILIEHGADLDSRDVLGRSALAIAAQDSKISCLAKLIAAGADIDAVDLQGRSALDRAHAQRHRACVVALLLGGARMDPASHMASDLAFSMTMIDRAPLKNLLDRGVPTNVLNDAGQTLAMSAAREGAAECLAEILSRPGVPLDARDFEEGRTAVYIASSEEHLECLELLIQAGADINIPTLHDGFTPLMAAPDMQCVMALLSAGADVSARDIEGRDAQTIQLAKGGNEEAAAIAAEGERRALATLVGAKPLARGKSRRM